ncbi:MAG: MCE family protein [Chitinivibrionales bacterium]|nr:MCE family protein [Chitinivibrionales bacterium]
MTDRQLGYAALFIIFAGCAAGVGYLLHATSKPSQIRVVTAENTGSLKLADPVVVGGVPVGVVRDLGASRSHAIITLQLTPPRPIHADYTIAIVDVGIMGDRWVDVDPGSASEPVIPPGDTLHARFILGPSEALGYVDRLHSVVRHWAEFSTILVQGDSSRPALVDQYARVIWFTDSLSTQVLELTDALDRFVTVHTDSIYRFLDTVAGLSNRAAVALPETIDRLSAQLAQLERGVAKVDTLLAQVQSLVSQTDSPEAARLNTLLARLQERLATVQKLLIRIRRYGVNLKVWPF